MGFLQEFKTFAMRGNVVDLAVGFIMGSAFNKVVDSLVADVVMPPIGSLLSGVDFSELVIEIPTPMGSEPVLMSYGLFINALINFTVVAFSVFLIVKLMNRLHATGEVQEMKSCPECKIEIPRDARRCGHCTSELS